MRPGFLREAALQAAAVALVAALAQLSIDLGTVPVTGQTLGVLLVGAALGARRGALAMTLYVLIGVLGAPVFASFGSGLRKPTGGYLVGFIAGAAWIGRCADRGQLQGFVRTALAMTAATVLVLVLGVPWLANYVPFREALHSGCVRLLPGAAIKVALASAIVVAFPRAFPIRSGSAEDPGTSQSRPRRESPRDPRESR